MKPPVAVLSLLLLAGCQPVTGPHPNLVRPAKSLATTPAVLVIGDELVTAWLTENPHPMWTPAGTPLGMQELSGTVGARLAPILMAQHFDLVVILAGTFDMADPAWLGLCNLDAAATAPYSDQTCQAMWQMFQTAHAAGAKVLICTLPVTEPESAVYTERMAEAETIYDENVVKALGEDTPAEWSEDAIVDLRTALIGVDWTSDGLLPNASGAQAFTSATEAVITTIVGDWGAK